MRIAVTGATGFLGRYIVNHLLEQGHACRCWYRPQRSDLGGFVQVEPERLTWVEGHLGEAQAERALLEGAEAVVHAALDRPGAGFSGAEGSLRDFAQRNIVGSLGLMETAQALGLDRFVFISTCAVHDVILQDRRLDEAHPLWAYSHYGAHKAAIEKFIHSFGLPGKLTACALRPTGIYGLAHPVEHSKWFGLVQQVLRGEPIASAKGGKEVHAADVAKAVGLLLEADAQAIRGQAYNCYDRYIADQDVARIAARIADVDAPIEDLNKGPKNQIDTSKIQALGMSFGGDELLEQTVGQLVQSVQAAV
jgi:nucleoside-diphosphate-sugar epimerase